MAFDPHVDAGIRLEDFRCLIEYGTGRRLDVRGVEIEVHAAQDDALFDHRRRGRLGKRWRRGWRHLDWWAGIEEEMAEDAAQDSAADGADQGAPQPERVVAGVADPRAVLAHDDPVLGDGRAAGTRLLHAHSGTGADGGAHCRRHARTI